MARSRTNKTASTGLPVCFASLSPRSKGILTQALKRPYARLDSFFGGGPSGRKSLRLNFCPPLTGGLASPSITVTHFLALGLYTLLVTGPPLRLARCP